MSAWYWWHFQGQWFKGQGHKQHFPKMHLSGGGLPIDGLPSNSLISIVSLVWHHLYLYVCDCLCACDNEGRTFARTATWTLRWRGNRVTKPTLVWSKSGDLTAPAGRTTGVSDMKNGQKSTFVRPLSWAECHNSFTVRPLSVPCFILFTTY